MVNQQKGNIFSKLPVLLTVRFSKQGKHNPTVLLLDNGVRNLDGKTGQVIKRKQQALMAHSRTKRQEQYKGFKDALLEEISALEYFDPRKRASLIDDIAIAISNLANSTYMPAAVELCLCGLFGHQEAQVLVINAASDLILNNGSSRATINQVDTNNNTVTENNDTLKMSSTSQKHKALASEPIDEKCVTKLPGIGKVLGKKLAEKGCDKAYQVLGQLLVFKKDWDMFKEWLKSIGANKKQAGDCYNGLMEWCNAFL